MAAHSERKAQLQEDHQREVALRMALAEKSADFASFVQVQEMNQRMEESRKAERRATVRIGELEQTAERHKTEAAAAAEQHEVMAEALAHQGKQTLEAQEAKEEMLSRSISLANQAEQKRKFRFRSGVEEMLLLLDQELQEMADAGEHEPGFIEALQVLEQGFLAHAKPAEDLVEREQRELRLVQAELAEITSEIAEESLNANVAEARSRDFAPHVTMFSRTSPAGLEGHVLLVHLDPLLTEDAHITYHVEPFSGGAFIQVQSTFLDEDSLDPRPKSRWVVPDDEEDLSEIVNFVAMAPLRILGVSDFDDVGPLPEPEMEPLCPFQCNDVQNSWSLQYEPAQR